MMRRATCLSDSRARSMSVFASCSLAARLRVPRVILLAQTFLRCCLCAAMREYFAGDGSGSCEWVVRVGRVLGRFLLVSWFLCARTDTTCLWASTSKFNQPYAYLVGSPPPPPFLMCAGNHGEVTLQGDGQDFPWRFVVWPYTSKHAN